MTTMFNPFALSALEFFVAAVIAIPVALIWRAAVRAQFVRGAALGAPEQ